MKRVVSIVLLVLVLASCANPKIRDSYQSNLQAGDQAAMSGDLQLAKQNYSSALKNVKKGRLGPEAEAMVLFRQARVSGYLCEYDEAEEGFIEANRLNEKSKGAGSEATYVTLVEIGQFNYDIGRYEKAVNYFEQALAIADKYGLSNKYPASFAGVYTDYADALKIAGDTSKAKEAQSKAASLNAKISKNESVYTRYPKSCKE